MRGGEGGGARKAIEKSVSPEGDEGVTMMAGRAAFSSTRGRVRSTKERDNTPKSTLVGTSCQET